jgi:hypothetical protein
MGNHTFGMDPRISSAGAMQIYFIPGHQAQAMLDFPLNGTCVPLSLPAAECRPVIADKQLDVSKMNRHTLKNEVRFRAIYGKKGAPVSPVFSANPCMMFMFCIAWPEAPLPMLSMADMTIILPVVWSIL